MQRLTRDRFTLTLSPEAQPAYRVEIGETLVVETHDCHGGQVIREGRSPDNLDTTRCGNPATGPIFVAGLKAGDTLAVHVLEIAVAERGVVCSGADYRIVELREGCAWFDEHLALPINPVIGVIGVAPGSGPIPTVTPGDHGGNLDTTDIRAGATVLLPVRVEGGLLALGDVHAVQGDGEVAGTGIETEAEITVRVSRGPRLSDRPCVLWPGYVATIGSAPAWPEAMNMAVEDMVRLVVERRGMTVPDARMLISLTGNLRVSQMVNPWMTARMVMPRDIVG